MDKTPAIIKMIIRGSVNFSKNCFHNGSFSGGVRMFTPYFYGSLRLLHPSSQCNAFFVAYTKNLLINNYLPNRTLSRAFPNLRSNPALDVGIPV